MLLSTVRRKQGSYPASPAKPSLANTLQLKVSKVCPATHQQPSLDLGSKRVLGRSTIVLPVRDGEGRTVVGDDCSSFGAMIGKRVTESREGRPRLPCIEAKVALH